MATMTRSMTAYALEEQATDRDVISCEIRTVNHRYLDLSLRLPDEIRGLEAELREQISEVLIRGKVDVVIHRRAQAQGQDGLQLDSQVLAQLAGWAAAMQAQFPALRVELTELLRFPGVMRRAETDPEQLRSAVLATLKLALQAAGANREREGGRLAEALLERLQRIDELLAELRGRLPQIRHSLHERLRQRMAGVLAGMVEGAPDSGRLEQELALQLTRMDVDEELDRLDGHLTEARRILASSGPAGRRLDFLMQEFNREANTLGSKSVDQQVSLTIVELKVLIEQMREQVQNIE